jgi:hypothetical protein
MIARHDCPNAKINRPLSYCTHVLRAYIWLSPIRLRMRLRPVFVQVYMYDCTGNLLRSWKAFRLYVPQFELRWITKRMLAESRAFMGGA